MLSYIIQRVLHMIPTLLVISIVVFVLIQLPPGDIVTSQLQELQQQGGDVSEAQIAAIRARYNLDDPLYLQYLKWIGGVLTGDLGYSLVYEQPVSDLVGERLALTALIAVSAILFTWAVAFPIGIFSALRQYSILDYLATVVAFLGMATPNFLLALVLMYVGYEYFGVSVGGLFSSEYANASWSFGKFMDLLAHIWIPMVVIGTAGTAGLMRILRANLLDELQKPYVTTALAKGVHPAWIVIKYPLRIAINPFISTIGWQLPRLFSGSAIVAVVLGLPTTGPLMLEALMNQDMELAGSFILILSTLVVVGTLLSDILLAAVDPRIRFE